MADNKSVAKKSTARGKKRVKRSIPLGQVHVQATFNNTIVSFTDNHGNVLSSSSAGACGFRGSKKGTAFAAQMVKCVLDRENVSCTVIYDRYHYSTPLVERTPPPVCFMASFSA